MSRRTLNNQNSGNSNPAKKFLVWKSNEKCFSYYDKEKGENILVDLPIKIQFLEHFHTVRGWNDASESGIYSNEVFLISKEELEVRSFKGGVISKGLYKDIKGNVNSAGGHYSRSVYALLNNEIVNIQLKGATVKTYSDFMAENMNNSESHFIEINKAIDMKKGSVKYSVPEMKLSKPYNNDENEAVNEAYKVINDYYSDYKSKDEESITEDEELDF